MTLKYVGFADSDKFIEAVDRKRPVNLNVGRQNGKPDRRFGILPMTLLLTISQVQGDEVLYFECAAYHWRSLNGEPMLQDTDLPRRLAVEVYDLAAKHLKDHDISFREALLAMPTNYLKMHGAAMFLQWDEARQSYLPKPEAAAGE